MKPFPAFVLAATVLLAPHFASSAFAQTPPGVAKMNAYVGCINRLSSRAYDSRKRYFSWVGKHGPTGRENIIYGTYTISDSAECQKKVSQANFLEPHDSALEAAATAYADAVVALEPLLKEADDYYTQEDYKDDKMAKGRAMHPKLVAAWDAFAAADRTLRAEVDVINDKHAVEKLAEIEKSEGKQARYHIQALMIQAKRVLRSEDAGKPDVAAIERAIKDYEDLIKGAEKFSGSALMDKSKIGSMYIGSAKSFLTTAKQLMRRIRDHKAYSFGDKMMLDAGSGWMVEGSPQRLMRDYNQLVDAYNRGARI